jgi:hypothetical protein
MKKSKMVALALSVVPESDQAEAQGKGDVLLLTYQEIERFAALVAEKEREACAKVCEKEYMKFEHPWNGAIRCAANIRARGNK